MTIQALLLDLSERLPELEWKLGNLDKRFSPKILPKGLFRLGMEAESRDFIAEIKLDIQALAKRRDERSALFLAGRIQQKINVLVTVCQLYIAPAEKAAAISYNMNKLATRQQWLQSLELEVEVLDKQLQALLSAQKKLVTNDKSAQLNLQAEIGEVQRRLTLARETFNKTTRI